MSALIEERIDKARAVYKLSLIKGYVYKLDIQSSSFNELIRYLFSSEENGMSKLAVFVWKMERNSPICVIILAK